ncbi:WAT1-related protein At5g07050 [Manihot esculenta]|uniref:WAT1-related protein n=2 Tax=Manihot esculenta TaxID=3983 RepID=A0A251KH61_MANES|nr:WAT1-related protein At5g07050 [Manihot esculenta]XP_021618181.2 WAT1-related protein At5g07050 [Manihot esculenta]KAG8650548.1 hypothetical protein MANES_07G057200v8 [Manihot esculenta]OAY45397.1 hypothetical protein MANES_07G057200v8 [Manihot esculenta]OAY45398.1 hypothetical protein MANES_07G057200v8 [Manihot esculenta]
MERERNNNIIEISKPYVLCLLSNFCFAAFNIISKLTLDNGMSRYVLVAYGHALATLTTALLALLFERKNESKLSLPVCGNIFFLGLLGAILRTTYLAGMECTSSTFASAMGNLIPAITFLSAICFRMEKLVLGKFSSKAQIVGTVVSFGGATLMTLYKGIVVISLQLGHNKRAHSQSKVTLDQDWIKGSFLLLVHCLSTAILYILQAKTIKKYPAPIALTTLSCLVGTAISTIVAAILDHKASSWRLSCNISLVATLYSGIVIFGIIVYVQMTVIRKKGPVFVTAFRPSSTVLAAVMGVLILGEALHLGSVLGAVLIIVGLYAILWGKEQEKAKENKLPNLAIVAVDHSIKEKPDSK